jgi:hypothetical protein
MAGLLAKIFGAGDVIEQGVKLIDSLHTSEEERIEAGSKAKTDLLTAYAPFKIAQRLLALIFSVTFVGSFLLVLVMTLMGKGNIDDVRAVISEFYVGLIMLTIIGFYFGGGAFEGIISSVGAKREAKRG